MINRPHLLLNHIHATSDVGVHRLARHRAWPYVLTIGFCAGLLIGKLL